MQHDLWIAQVRDQVPGVFLVAARSRLRPLPEADGPKHGPRDPVRGQHLPPGLEPHVARTEVHARRRVELFQEPLQARALPPHVGVDLPLPVAEPALHAGPLGQQLVQPDGDRVIAVVVELEGVRGFLRPGVLGHQLQRQHYRHPPAPTDRSSADCADPGAIHRARYGSRAADRPRSGRHRTKLRPRRSAVRRQPSLRPPGGDAVDHR